MSLEYTKSISHITKLPGISYSVSVNEPRIREYKDYSYTSFPKQTQINYLDFIYEK
jgi:hypothetical protein